MESKVSEYLCHKNLNEQINLDNLLMENKEMRTGMIMDAVNQTETQKQAKENLDAAVGVKQEQLLEAMARYKAAHTPKIKEYKIGRNDPCPCGSGLKFKKCCINKSEYNKYICKN